LFCVYIGGGLAAPALAAPLMQVRDDYIGPATKAREKTGEMTAEDAIAIARAAKRQGL